MDDEIVEEKNDEQIIKEFMGEPVDTGTEVEPDEDKKDIEPKDPENKDESKYKFLDSELQLYEFVYVGENVVMSKETYRKLMSKFL